MKDVHAIMHGNKCGLGPLQGGSYGAAPQVYGSRSGRRGATYARRRAGAERDHESRHHQEPLARLRREWIRYLRGRDSRRRAARRRYRRSPRGHRRRSPRLDCQEREQKRRYHAHDIRHPHFRVAGPGILHQGSARSSRGGASLRSRREESGWTVTASPDKDVNFC